MHRSPTLARLAREVDLREQRCRHKSSHAVDEKRRQRVDGLDQPAKVSPKTPVTSVSGRRTLASTVSRSVIAVRRLAPALTRLGAGVLPRGRAVEAVVARRLRRSGSGGGDHVRARANQRRNALRRPRRSGRTASALCRPDRAKPEPPGADRPGCSFPRRLEAPRSGYSSRVQLVILALALPRHLGYPRWQRWWVPRRCCSAAGSPACA